MDANFGEVDCCNFADTFYGMSSQTISRNDNEEMVALLGNPVELLDISRHEISGNDCLDALNMIQMFREMKVKYCKTLKAVESLKCELLTARSCICALEAEVKDLKGCKENMEMKLQQMNFKKALEDIESAISFENASHEERAGRECASVKTFCNSRYMQLHRGRELQHIDITSENFNKWLGMELISSATQTDTADDLNEISSLIAVLNEVTSKYKALCLEKAVLERNLMHVANEKEVESSKFLRERQIRQKCLNKMEKLKEERDAAVAEYHLVMSERDVVHKEINQLQDQLAEVTAKLQDAQAKIEYLERRQRVAIGEEEEQVMSEFDQVLDESQTTEEFLGRQSARDVCGPCSNRGSIGPHDDPLAAATAWMQDNLKENDSLKRQLQRTINEFAKRDRIVRERDSMRIMCDQLRRDRDNTVSELIRAKKQSDELKKQRNQALDELKTLRDSFGGDRKISSSRGEADDFISHGHSKDSAIDSDFQEWETEIVNLNIELDNSGELGFELAGGHKDGRGGSQYVYVKSVLSSCHAHGVIQTNDQIMQINNVDVTGADTSLICRLILQGPAPVNLLVKRKKFCSKLSQNASLQLLGNASSSQRNSKVDLPPLPPSASTQGGLSVPKQQSKKVATTEKVVDATTTTTGDHYGQTNDELGLLENAKSSKVWQRKNVTTDGNESTLESSKTKKNILNKAFMALAKPFKVIPRDSRSRSSTHRPGVSKEDEKSPPEDLRREAGRRLHRETWPKCRDAQPAFGVKKSRPKLHPDVAFVPVKDSLDREERETNGPEEDDDGVRRGGASGNDPIKTSLVCHYVQLSDPLGYVCPSKDDSWNEVEEEEEEKELFHHRTNFSEEGQKHVEEEINSRKEAFVDMNAESDCAACETSFGTNAPVSSPEREGDANKQPPCAVYSGAAKDIPEIKESKTGETFIQNERQPIDDFKRHVESMRSPNEDLIWHHPPAHQFLMAIEERVSGAVVPSRGASNTRSLDPCPYHDGAAGKSRDIYPAFASNFYHHKGVNGTKTLPHMHSHFNNSRRFIDASLFRAQGHDATRRSHHAAAVRHASYNPNYDKTNSHIFVDGSPDGSYSLSHRVEKRQALREFAVTSLPSPLPHPSSSINALESSMLDKEGSIFDRPFSPSSPSMNFCLPLEMDIGRAQVPFGTQRQRNFSVFDSNPPAAPPRNVQMAAYDSPAFKGSAMGPSNQSSWQLVNPGSHHHSHSGQTGSRTGLVNVSQHGLRNESFGLPRLDPRLGFYQALEGCNDIKLVNKSRNETRQANKPQRHSEPVDFGSEPLHRGGGGGGGGGRMQLSSISDNGLTFDDVFRDVDLALNEVSVESLMKLAEINLSDKGAEINLLDEGPSSCVDVLHSKSSAAEAESKKISFVAPERVMESLHGGHGDFNAGVPSSTTSDDTQTENIVRSVVAEKRRSESPKVSLAGGNTVGIYVAGVAEGSVLDGSRGLRVGDKILEFNGVSFCNVLLEEAVLELSRPCEKITCQVQYCGEDYKKIRERPCDSLYVRALFDNNPHPTTTMTTTTTANSRGGGEELFFSKGDVLLVEGTCFDGRVGTWWAHLLDTEGQKTRCGLIISRMNRRAEGGGYFIDWRSEENAPVSGGSVRRSFFKRCKPQTAASREDGNASQAELPAGEIEMPLRIPDDESFGLYERVEKFDTNLSRPVLIVGPFANQIIAKLAKDFPYKFYKFIPEFGRKKLDVGSISYGTETGGTASIPLSLLKNSMMAHHHSLLNFPVDLVPKFQPHKIHFIVILIKFKSYKQIKETRDSDVAVERMSTKQARESHDVAVAAERKFKHLITEVVPGGCTEATCSAVVEAIDRQQKKQIWTPWCRSSSESSL